MALCFALVFCSAHGVRYSTGATDVRVDARDSFSILLGTPGSTEVMHVA